MTLSTNEYVLANEEPETNPERIKTIGAVISWDFISCAGLYNLERSRDREFLDSKGGRLWWSLPLIFGFLSSPFPDPRWMQDPERK